MEEPDYCEVFLSKRAYEDLEQIQAFIRRVFSEEIAEESIKRVFDRIEFLGAFPYAGRKDPRVRDQNQEVRYVTEGSSRIQYIIEGRTVVILQVLDSRESPRKG